MFKFTIIGESATDTQASLVKVLVEVEDNYAAGGYEKLADHLRSFVFDIVKNKNRPFYIGERHFDIKDIGTLRASNSTGLYPQVEWEFQGIEIHRRTKTIKEWCKVIHQNNRDKGWYDGTPRTALENHMLFVSEIAEATEEVRTNKPAIYWSTPTGIVTNEDVGGSYNLSVGPTLQKPEGEATELADVVIRIMDYFGAKGWDLEKTIKMKHEYNRTRAHRHGGKAL